MAAFSYNLLFIVLVIHFVYNFKSASSPNVSSSANNNKNAGFIMPLIHRDSPHSPYYNKTATRHELLVRAIARSYDRVNSHKTGLHVDDVQLVLLGRPGEYLIEFHIGTPVQVIYSMIDTGSSFIWNQCEACFLRGDSCVEPKEPVFDPDNSDTYKRLPCTNYGDCKVHESCDEGVHCVMGFNSYCDSDSFCKFQSFYADATTASGEMALETFSFVSPNGDGTATTVSIPKIIFGCSNKNNIVKENSQLTGIIGLGLEKTSLISQLSPWIGAKQFSYCLVNPFSMDPENIRGNIKFGKLADVLEGEGVVSTPIITIPKDKDAYFLRLTAFYVGDTPGFSVPEDMGLITIDSGSMLTFLPPLIYEDIKSRLLETIDYEPISNPGGGFDLCYNYDADEDDHEMFPNIRVNFTGASIVLESFNNFLFAFHPRDAGQIMRCFTMVSSPRPDVFLFGVFSQVNFIIKHDVQNMKLTFKSADCSSDKIYN